jgi:P2 family phage contractile tail tube protein
MAQLDYILQAFTIYIDGFGHAGGGEECKPPVLKKTTEKYRGGGMLAAREVSLGYESFTFGAKFSSTDPQILTKGGLFVGNKSFAFSVRAYLDGDANLQHTSIIQMRGEVTKLDAGSWQAGKKAMLDFEASLAFVKWTIDGAVVWNIDVENFVYAVGGTDPSANIRAALGF